ncbi:hypothetical protein JNUCC64_15385 [Streptomyces sp. JNUCC 64]
MQDHVALAEIELCGELIIAASTTGEERLSAARIDEVLRVRDARDVRPDAVRSGEPGTAGSAGTAGVTGSLAAGSLGESGTLDGAGTAGGVEAIDGRGAHEVRGGLDGRGGPAGPGCRGVTGRFWA